MPLTSERTSGRALDWLDFCGVFSVKSPDLSRFLLKNRLKNRDKSRNFILKTQSGKIGKPTLNLKAAEDVN